MKDREGGRGREGQRQETPLFLAYFKMTSRLKVFPAPRFGEHGSGVQKLRGRERDFGSHPLGHEAPGFPSVYLDNLVSPKQRNPALLPTRERDTELLCKTTKPMLQCEG